MRMRYSEYKEVKPHYLWLVIWRILNVIVYPVMPSSIRKLMLRIFGAKFGRNCGFSRSARIYAPWNLRAGDAICFAPGVKIYNKAMLSIGSGVVVSQCAWLCTASHDCSSPTFNMVAEPISIGSDCWIAANASILPGVTIGDGVVVGACAVVAKDVEPWSVVGGNPAKFIKKRELKDAD